jgi:hypothetical protein
VAYPFVESPNKTPTKGRTIDLVVIHTAEVGERRDAAGPNFPWPRFLELVRAASAPPVALAAADRSAVA